MNQAADRIMNLDIFCKKNERYTLKYIPNANASVKNNKKLNNFNK
jgi:hypothetical protein